MEYVIFYIEAYLACFFLLGIILFKIQHGVNKQLSQVYLGNLTFVTMLYFLAEVFWAIVDGGIISTTRQMLYLSNIFTYVLLSIAAYQWFLYFLVFRSGFQLSFV